MLLYFFLLGTFLFATETEGKKYNRIISLTLSGDEMLLSLVKPNQIVGLSGKINQDSDVSNVVIKAKSFPRIENNVEEILNLDPDFVIAADWMKKESLSELREMGVPIYVYKTPKNFEEQKKLILELSSLIGEKKTGQRIVDDMEKRLLFVQKNIVRTEEGKPRIILYTPFETTSGKGTTFDDMVKKIGGINLASEAGIFGSKQISKEELIALNPDIIIVPVWKNYSSEEASKRLLQDPSFQNIKALQTKKVYFMPYRQLSPTSQYMIDGIEALAKVVYQKKEK